MTKDELIKILEDPDMNPDHHKCSGIRASWPWRGYPCGAVAKYDHDGKRYCGTHYAKAKEQEKEGTP